jgi:hypothetical protein
MPSIISEMCALLENVIGVEDFDAKLAHWITQVQLKVSAYYEREYPRLTGSKLLQAVWY